MRHFAVIGAGANLGDREASLRQGVRSVDELSETRILRISSVYETEPWGVVDQPAFLNMVFSVSTAMPALDLLRALQAIESRLGRVRRERWGARHLDLDLLLYDRKAIETPELTLPHPGLGQRNFVLVPLRQIYPDLIEPRSGATVVQLCDRCPDGKAVSCKGSFSWP